MAYGNYGGVAYPAPNYYNGYNPVPDQGNRYPQYGQNANYSLGSPVAPAPQSSSGIIWVQGEEGAKAYMVAPGCAVPLWDSENQVIYIKSVDMSGMPSMRIFDYVERTGAKTPAVSSAPMSNFVTRDEFSALEERFNALAAKEQAKSTKTSKSKEDVDNG